VRTTAESGAHGLFKSTTYPLNPGLYAWHLPCCQPGNDLTDRSGHNRARRCDTCWCSPRSDYYYECKKIPVRVNRRSPRLKRSSAGVRPRVVLVDDHRHVLDRMSAMLADDFDVVGVATEGSQALQTARRVDPDVIVLDVDMPGLDGFQTLRALKQEGLAATPAVFLSMHEADEIIDAAFQCGARGYVVKSHLGRDLASALDQALLGGLFVPSLTSLFRLTHASMHAMQVHRDVETFVDGLAFFFDLALRRGDATCVIASEPVREGLSVRLRARGWHVGGSSGHKRILVIDASGRRRPASAQPEHLQHDGYATGFAGANDAFKPAAHCRRGDQAAAVQECALTVGYAIRLPL